MYDPVKELHINDYWINRLTNPPSKWRGRAHEFVRGTMFIVKSSHLIKFWHDIGPTYFNGVATFDPSWYAYYYGLIRGVEGLTPENARSYYAEQGEIDGMYHTNGIAFAYYEGIDRVHDAGPPFNR